MFPPDVSYLAFRLVQLTVTLVNSFQPLKLQLCLCCVHISLQCAHCCVASFSADSHFQVEEDTDHEQDVFDKLTATTQKHQSSLARVEQELESRISQLDTLQAQCEHRNLTLENLQSQTQEVHGGVKLIRYTEGKQNSEGTEDSVR